MTNTFSSQYEILNCEADAIDSQPESNPTQLPAELSMRRKVSRALGRSIASFAVQCTQPDASKYAQACHKLERFLDLGIPLEQSEQHTLVHLLQIACAVHENAIHNAKLVSLEYSAQLPRANVNFVTLCNQACNYLRQPELMREVSILIARAKRAANKINVSNPLTRTTFTTPNGLSHNANDPERLEEQVMPSAEMQRPELLAPRRTQCTMPTTMHASTVPNDPLPNINSLNRVGEQAMRDARMRQHGIIELPILTPTVPNGLLPNINSMNRVREQAVPRVKMHQPGIIRLPALGGTQSTMPPAVPARASAMPARNGLLPDISVHQPNIAQLPPLTSRGTPQNTMPLFMPIPMPTMMYQPSIPQLPPFEYVQSTPFIFPPMGITYPRQTVYY